MKINKNVSTYKKVLTAKQHRRKSSLELLLLACPCILWFLIFSYTPMFGLVMAFQKFNYREGIFGSSFVGFDNFQYLLKSLDAVRIVRNTVLYNLLFMVVLTTLAVTVAIMINALRHKWEVKLFQTSFFLPYFISWVMVGYISTSFFDYRTGFLNQFLKFLGQDVISWYQTPSVWPLILTFFHVWKNIGYQSVIYLGAIVAIDVNLFEAAYIDGCNKLQSIHYITIPQLKPMVIILFLMGIGGMMRSDFGLFYYIPNNVGMLYEVTDVIDTYLFRSLTDAGNISVSAAIGFFQSIVGFFLVIFANWITKKYESGYALF